jgi:hypothetical protein
MTNKQQEHLFVAYSMLETSTLDTIIEDHNVKLEKLAIKLGKCISKKGKITLKFKTILKEYKDIDEALSLAKKASNN